jgi:hypothetical protein
MKVTCPISGVNYDVSFPQAGISVAPHPLLSPTISVKVLTTTYLQQWAAGRFNQEETHLLGMAFILKLPLEASPVLGKRSAEQYSAFWAKYMERVAKLAKRIDGKLDGNSRLFKNLPTLRASD